MTIRVEPYDPSHIEAVRAFNQRLATGGVPDQFPETPVPRWLPRVGNRSVYEEYFVAMEDRDARGGYVLKHQRFQVRGEEMTIGHYRFPLAEGTTSPRHAPVGAQLLFDCLRRHPLVYSLGIGGEDESHAKVLKAAGWITWLVPFYFRVLRPGRFLRNIRPLRRTQWRALACDLAALTGLGALALLSYQRLRTRQTAPVDYVAVPRFDTWVDHVWAAGKTRFDLVAVRDTETLDVLYPARRAKFIRLRVRAAGEDVGWAVCLCTPMHENKYFGNMQLGSLVDCFAAPGQERSVVEAAVTELRRRCADIVVTNQSHSAWCVALEQGGFLRGPSNFLFAASRQLASRLQPFESVREAIHLTRGDGHGAVHL